MLSITMTKTKETKGTYVYSADTQEGEDIVQTLYIKKDAFKGKKAPEFITVTVSEGQE